MAVHIRLQRKGATHRPFYYVVATDHRNARDGRFIEKLGYYDPNCEPSVMELKNERIQYWFSKGAVLSNPVSKMCKIKDVKLARTLG